MRYGSRKKFIINSKEVVYEKDAIRTTKKVPGAMDAGTPTYQMTVNYVDSEVVDLAFI